LYAAYDGACLNADLTNNNPPLDCMLAEISFRVFGVSTLSARLPFVLIGLGALGLFLAILRRDLPDRPRLALAAGAVLGLSVNYLLDIRTCRYYGLALALCLLAYYAYRRYIDTRRLRDLCLLLAAGILLFLCHYLICADFLASLGVLLVAFDRRKLAAPDWRRLAAAATVFLGFSISYAVGHRIWTFQYNRIREPWAAHHLALLWWNTREINTIDAFPWMLAVILALILAAQRFLRIVPDRRGVGRGIRERGQMPGFPTETAWRWIVLSASYVLFLSLTSPQPTYVANVADIRYEIPLLPFLAGLSALALYGISYLSRMVAVVVAAVFICSNLLCLTPHGTFQWLLPSYLKEITHPYPTANALAAAYIAAHARQDDQVAADPEYLNYPLAFYDGNRIRLCCQLDNRTPLPLTVIRSLHAPLLISENFPDWIVCFGIQPDTDAMLGYFMRRLEARGRSVTHTYALAALLPVYWKETQRPELPWHRFGPERTFSRETESVYIFHRTR
jgi:hypothetical protein